MSGSATRLTMVFACCLQSKNCLGANSTDQSAAGCTSAVVQFRLANNPNKCLDIRGGQAVDGAEVQIWDCNGGGNQNLMWCSDGRIVSALNDNMCLDVPGGDVNHAHDLQMWQCNGRTGQYWQYDGTNKAIFPPSTGEKMCLDVAGGKSSNGARANLYYCSPGSGEQWFFGSGPPPAPAPPPVPSCSGGKGIVQYFQMEKDSKKCMDIVGGKAANGAAVQIWDCNGGQNQKFIWCTDGRIVSAMNDRMCLDVPGGDPSRVNNLQMWECVGGRGQYWSYDAQNMAIFPPSTGEKMCVDVSGGSTTPGSRVNLYGCSPGSGEKWQINKAFLYNTINV